jgi:hypothetical protein
MICSRNGSQTSYLPILIPRLWFFFVPGPNGILMWKCPMRLLYFELLVIDQKCHPIPSKSPKMGRCYGSFMLMVHFLLEGHKRLFAFMYSIYLYPHPMKYKLILNIFLFLGESFSEGVAFYFFLEYCFPFPKLSMNVIYKRPFSMHVQGMG